VPDANHDWMAALDASGLLVSEPVLHDHFPQGPPPVGDRLRRRVTTEWERFQLRPEDGQSRWLSLVLEDLTGIGRERWRKHPQIPEQTIHALAEYRQTLRPSRVLVDDAGEPRLLVWIAPAEHDLDRRETESGTWRASPSTKLERLMREVDVPLGLTTNGRQFRLMFAGEGVTPHITWTATDWMDDPATLDAFAMLLGEERFFGDEDSRLLALVEQSQQRQLAVTDQLGDQVRAALDQFVRAVGQRDQAADGEILRGMSFEEIYEMSLVFMMRLVFLLYGEENALLPHGEVLYDRSYGITHLSTRLAREEREDAPAMRRRHDAFPQLLATFRLIHEGCEHPDLSLLGYGGNLFDPARFPALEDPRTRISNATMHDILHRLIFARGKVGRTTINQRLSYRELDVEQLGSVYEGLIDGMVKRADETMVTIASGDEPIIALRELESRQGDDLADFLRSVSSMSRKKADSAVESDEPALLDDIDGAESLDADLLRRVAPYADFLDVGATVLPGDLYMVNESGARKAGGQYYTPKWITRFICERTLEPLVYEGEGDERRIKSPEDILALNVCDPAMGSGAFLVQACRYLAERLVDSWDACVEREGGQVTLPFGEPASEAEGTPRLLPDEHDEAIIWARRFVADNCLYGVDVNPLAVELAKMSLWLATLSQDRPFTFLDHKLKLGNSIIGAWAEDIDRYPAAAWDRKAETGSPLNETLKEVRRQVREQLKQAEKDAKTGARQLLSAQVPDVREQASQAMLTVEAIDTLHPEQKEREYHRLLEENERWQATKRMYDAWCALWFWPVAPDGAPPSVPPRAGEGRTETAPAAVPPSGTEGGAGGRPPSDLPLLWAYRELQQHLQPGGEAPVLSAATPEKLERWQQTIERLRRELRFFHWELEFPDVFEERAGFDAIVMNPPWERIKLQENEFFATRDPEIAGAPNAAARRRLIKQLPDANPALYAEFRHEKAIADNTGSFLRDSGHFPLTAVGDINLYPIFAGLGRRLISPIGGVGAVIPSGIATDYYTQDFFRDLMETRSLSALYDFENREGIFHGVHRSYKFSLFFVSGPARGGAAADFAFFLQRPDHMEDDWRHFELTEEEIELLNPNTRTCPIFRSQRDAELTKAVYRRHPVLVREVYDEHGEQVGEENPWEISPQTMFHMANDSDLFSMAGELDSSGYELQPIGSRFCSNGKVMLPLYEGKMMQAFDHRAASIVRNEANLNRPAQPDPATLEEHLDPSFSVLPEYWVAEEAVSSWVEGRTAPEWLIALKSVTSVTNERTAILSAIPMSGVGHNTTVICHYLSGLRASCLLCTMNSYAFDFVARQKVGATYLSNFILEQLPVIAPSRYEEEFCGERLADVVAGRVLELVYTAWDIRAFAQDLGDEGPPFVWDEERRAQLRAQLDAIYFHLYGIERADVEYIMSTFPIVERKDRAAHGTYRTRDLILGYYDAYAAGDPSALQTWLGPEGKRTARRHSAETRA
jgi:hypothetical protein